MSYKADNIQNVEVSKKIAPEMSASDQLLLMEKYTDVHKNTAGKSKEEREAACLSVIFPALFRSIEPGDLIAGRLDFLPIGFGSVTSLGGVGHYCVFRKLKEFKKQIPEADWGRVDALYDYWLENDLKAKYCRTELKDNIIGMFVDFNAPMIATARLSGMMLDYRTLLALGIDGLSDKIEESRQKNGDSEFYRAADKCIGIFKESCDCLIEKTEKGKINASPSRIKELERMKSDLCVIKGQAPQTFTQALQLFWLYALLAGVINYGRMDNVLGDFLVNDLQEGRLSETEAYAIIKSLWTMIENRRTTVNGRIIVGGRGRRNPENADVFARLALKVSQSVRYVEPQFTLRFDKNTPDDIMETAFDNIGAGATYPVLYNDDVNIPAIMHAMRIDEKAAEQYVPYGCGEYVIQGQSVGTSNTNVNLLKLLQIAINGGLDPMDGIDKSDGVPLKKAEEIQSFDELFDQYKRLIDHYLDLCVKAQVRSYEIMNKEVSFLFTSMLTSDCLEKGKAVLDGGIRYLGGTNETYGNINASDSLAAIKKYVFDEKRFSLAEIRDAANDNFEHNEQLRVLLREAPKYGNDDDYADDLAVELYEYVAKNNRNKGIEVGLQYYLAVISNNQQNTEWGRCTAASYDGRLKGQYMNPANNPQGGANVKGPTAMLRSISKIDAGLHGGSVQNIRFTPAMINGRRKLVRGLLDTYFEMGGCQIMITVIDHGTLLDAQKHPENYRDLIVRVSGFSAVFVDLEKDVQDELISRVLYG